MRPQVASAPLYLRVISIAPDTAGDIVAAVDELATREAHELELAFTAGLAHHGPVSGSSSYETLFASSAFCCVHSYSLGLVVVWFGLCGRVRDVKTFSIFSVSDTLEYRYTYFIVYSAHLSLLYAKKYHESVE